MIYVVLLVGLVLIALTGKTVVREWREDTKTSRFDELSLLEHYQSIEDKLGVIADNLHELHSYLQNGGKSDGQQVFGFDNVWQAMKQEVDEVDESKLLSFNDRVRHAYQQGKDITELAKQFGKGKGEIELILNLRR